MAAENRNRAEKPAWLEIAESWLRMVPYAKRSGLMRQARHWAGQIPRIILKRAAATSRKRVLHPAGAIFVHGGAPLLEREFARGGVVTLRLHPREIIARSPAVVHFRNDKIASSSASRCGEAHVGEDLSDG